MRKLPTNTEVHAPETAVRLTERIRDEYVSRFGLGLFPHTAAAVAELAGLLAAEGLHGQIVTGHYDHPFPWPDESNSDVTGHSWIEIEGFILDPTREQFGDLPLVLPSDSEDAAVYRAAERYTF